MKNRYKLVIWKDGWKRYYKNDLCHRRGGPSQITIFYSCNLIFLSYDLDGKRIKYEER